MGLAYLFDNVSLAPIVQSEAGPSCNLPSLDSATDHEIEENFDAIAASRPVTSTSNYHGTVAGEDLELDSDNDRAME